MTRVAVIGAGWAGLAAAVQCRLRGCEVSLFEMAREPGGRARSVSRGALELDNGQHILIGAYHRTLALMQTVGVDPGAALARLPLELTLPAGGGLKLPPGHPLLAFARGTIAHRGWPVGARLALLRWALRWHLAGFRCHDRMTVADLTHELPRCVRAELIEPLSVAALNTPSDQASATVLLRVLRDALFGERGSADLLLPRRPLGDLLPRPALHWLTAHGGRIHLGHRVQTLSRAESGWAVDGTRHDAVVVAASATEAARLIAPIDRAWADSAVRIPYEPIITVVLESPGAHLSGPMVVLPGAPAQFAFDHGAIGGPPGRFSFVISGASNWAARGRDATQAAVAEQAARDFPSATWPTAPVAVATMLVHRATFCCTPKLVRPPAAIAPGLLAAGDYVAGPYPATLEGAVLSGMHAAEGCS